MLVTDVCALFEKTVFVSALIYMRLFFFFLQAAGGAKSGKLDKIMPRTNNQCYFQSLTLLFRICKLMCCVYAYDGIAEPEETAFACSIALQAFFEGRTLTKEDMDKCIAFWKENISELEDPIGRKRPVCCEPIYVPCCDAVGCYKAVHPKRTVPYAGDGVTDKLVEAYDKYAAERKKQVRRYKNARGPLRNSTLCRTMGCRRVFGRKGFCFCTEGCNHCDRKAGEPAPPMEVVDLDDYFDASTVLIKVLGPPPSHVVIKRWRYDPERGEQVLEVYPEEKNTEE